MSQKAKQFRLGLAAWMLAFTPWFGPFPQADSEEVQVHVTQVDTSKFPTITVYVSATDSAGEPVAVDPNSIVLYEDGQAVAWQQVGGAGQIGPLTTLLVMDVSGSMNEAGKLGAAKAAARAYVEQMRPGDQAGLLTFNTQTSYVQTVTTDREALLKAIDGVKAAQDTAMYDALAQAVQILEPLDGRKAIIALTDGLDNRSSHTPDQVIELIGPGGLSISTVGLGDPSQLRVSNAGLDQAALQSLAEQAGGEYGYANDPQSLRALYERYGRVLQSEYVFTYTSPATLRDGVTRNLVVASSAGAQPAAAAGYNPGGLVPEVQGVSWWLFGAALAGLLSLLLLPALLSRGLAAFRRVGARRAKPAKRGGRVRLREDKPEPRIRLR